MKAVVFSMLLACVVAVVYGDYCRHCCRDHPCSTYILPYSCKYPAVYRNNHEGMCGCCPACVTLLTEGAPCEIYAKESGHTPSAVCLGRLGCLGGVCTAWGWRNWGR